MPNQEYIEDEINLRDYINVIIKRKMIILTVFLVSVIITAIVSFRMPKVYQATASIMITPSRLQTMLSPTAISLDVREESPTGVYLGQKPTISLPTYKMLLKSNTVLERLINGLKLTDPSGKLVMPEDISNKLEIKETKETNILELKAEDISPKMAMEIANIWAQEYTKYSQELISGEIKGTGDFIDEQFEIARQNLVRNEETIKNFDVKGGLSLMRIELKEKNNELESIYGKIYQLEFQLVRKKKNLQKINDDILAMTKNGTWLGVFDLRKHPQEYFKDSSLSIEQVDLREKILEAKNNLQIAEEERNNFINNTKLELLRQEFGKKRENLLNDKSALAEVERLSKVTEANLKSKGTLDKTKQTQGYISQNLLDSTVWEILSLEEKYNFFKTRQQSLESKVKQEELELKTLEKDLFNYEGQLKVLNESLDRAQTNYNFYLEKFKALENAMNSTESEIADLEFQLSKLREPIKRLELEVQVLKEKVNDKEAILIDLNRKVEIYKRTYDNLSSKIEEAHIAKAAQLGEVKIISLALEPKYPIKPSKRKNVAISGIVSLMFGTFLAFFIEYWEKSKREQ